MRLSFHRAATVLVVLAALLAFAADKPQSRVNPSALRFTGKVSDSMCGAQHMMAGASDADCTRACVKKGSKYALVVGDKVYTLEGGDATFSRVLAYSLDKLAGENATVTGTLKEKTITVTSVARAK